MGGKGRGRRRLPEKNGQDESKSWNEITNGGSKRW